MKVFRLIEKIPAYLMLVPMFAAVLLHTFVPQVLEIGSFTTATFSNAGAATIMGVQLVCMGSALKVREVPGILRRGGILLAVKLCLGFLAAGALAVFTQANAVAGISVLALIAAISNTNGSLYQSLMITYGDAADSATVSLVSFSNGPFFTLLVLGMSGQSSFTWISVVAAILPLFVGMLLGNLSSRIREFLAPGSRMLLPFVGFALGAGIDLQDILYGGMTGVLLSAIVLVAGGGLAYLADRYLNRRPGYAGVAISATGANAVAVPAAIALLDPSWAPYVEQATAQIAAAVVLTAIVVPVWTARVALRHGRNILPKESK
ncbi:MAG: 2-keto-3-deoxygluconate permease [Lachnospiraceae bacterium]